VIRFLDQIVGDWGIFSFEQGGEQMEQVEAHLYNGMTIIMDVDDFFNIADDEGCWL
jgi:hypothetical protein